MASQYQRGIEREDLPSETEARFHESRIAQMLSDSDGQAEQAVDVGKMKEIFFWNLMQYKNVEKGIEKNKSIISAITHIICHGLNALMHSANPMRLPSSIPQTNAIARSVGSKCVSFFGNKSSDSAWERLDTSIRAINAVIQECPQYIQDFREKGIHFHNEDNETIVVDIDSHLEAIFCP